jgi:hypothetical protein
VDHAGAHVGRAQTEHRARTYAVTRRLPPQPPPTIDLNRRLRRRGVLASAAPRWLGAERRLSTPSADRRLRPPTREPRRVHATQTSATTVRADEVAHHESAAVGLTRAMPSTAPASLRRPVGHAALYARPPSSGIREWEVRSSWRSRTRGSGVLPVVRGHRRRQRVLCGSVAHRGITAVVPLSRVSFRPSAEPSD